MKLRADFGVPQNKVFSWKEHVKKHDLRIHAAKVLAQVADIQILYVYAMKSELTQAKYAKDPTLFYNYVAGKMFKSILNATSSWNGEAFEFNIRFGHVRHHDHSNTKRYLLEKLGADPKIRADLLLALRWVSADNYVESQAADLYGGFLKAALWPQPTPWGDAYTYSEFLREIWHQVRGSQSGCAIPWGIMSMPKSELFANSGLVECADCKFKTSN